MYWVENSRTSNFTGPQFYRPANILPMLSVYHPEIIRKLLTFLLRSSRFVLPLFLGASWWNLELQPPYRKYVDRHMLTKKCFPNTLRTHRSIRSRPMIRRSKRQPAIFPRSFWPMKAHECILLNCNKWFRSDGCIFFGAFYFSKSVGRKKGVKVLKGSKGVQWGDAVLG